MAQPIPVFSAAAIEAVCRELAEAATGSQVTHLIRPLRVKEPTGAATTTKWKRLFYVATTAQQRQKDGRPLIRLITEVMQPVRFRSPEAFEHARAAINTKLLLYGYEVRPDGRVGKAEPASSLSEAHRRADALGAALQLRNVHPRVLAFCREELLQDNYFHAVLEAAKSVADRIREMTGVDKDGAELVDQVTSLKSGNPRLAFNGLKTEWDRSEHTGLAMLAKGLFSTVRNPTAHAPRVKWAVELDDALDVLTLASLLHRRLDTALT